MIIYGARPSPFVRKVIVFAAEKGIAVEVRPAGFGKGGAEFERASPFGKIPALVDGDFAISDSTAIITYMDALHPEPNLIPTEPKARARTVWYEEYADSIFVGAAGPIFFNRVVGPRFMGAEPDLAAIEKGINVAMPPVLDYLERTIPASGFLVEDRFTLADIAVASPFVNLEHAGFDFGQWPKAKAYADAILARPSFADIIKRERRILGA